ncbi:MAG: alpha/beta fold hydrolase [Hyphomicrobiales bacterium]|nr:alpha/beta fold hydrolase [Hyphomicrobiales bacterium]
MTSEIRQTVTIDGRTLHLRRFGSGPPVVLLHESPRSSAVLVPLATKLASRFTVFALDSPGYGISDPLPLARPTVEDFADAIAQSLKALGLKRAGVYGTHTGASIALAMAKRHPDFVCGAVLDGYPVFTSSEADLHAYHYLPPFEAAWDGSHVARLWSRVRDQYTFFPWYQPGRDNRLRREPPAPPLQTAVVRDILAAGRHYATGYEAAFRSDGIASLAAVMPPVCIMCREDDLLFPHLDRLPSLPASMSIVKLGTDRGIWAERVGEEFAMMIRNADAPAPAFGIAGRPTGALCALDGGVVARCYDTGARELAPLVLLHDLPGRSRDWHPVALREAQRRVVLALDLPGAGVSAATSANPDDAAALVRHLLAALSAHGVTAFDVGGCGLGALLALDLALAAGSAGRRVLLLDPPPLAPVADKPVRPLPDWHGGHLLAAWYEARDSLLFRLPGVRNGAAAREVGPGLDVKAVQARFEAAVMAEDGGFALAGALAARRHRLADHDLSGCQVVLRSGDPDHQSLAETLGKAGAMVHVSHYDLLADAAVAALRS